MNSNRLLFFLMVLYLSMVTVNGMMKCSCKCCRSLLCLKPNHVSIDMMGCTSSSCKTACKRFRRQQCDYKLGKIVPTCSKIATTTQMQTTRATTTPKLASPTRNPYFERYGAPMCHNGVCMPGL